MFPPSVIFNVCERDWGGGGGGVIIVWSYLLYLQKLLQTMWFHFFFWAFVPSMKSWLCNCPAVCHTWDDTTISTLLSWVSLLWCGNSHSDMFVKRWGLCTAADKSEIPPHTNLHLYASAIIPLSLQATRLSQSEGISNHTPSLCVAVYHSWQINASISGQVRIAVWFWWAPWWGFSRIAPPLLSPNPWSTC